MFETAMLLLLVGCLAPATAPVGLFEAEPSLLSPLPEAPLGLTGSFGEFRSAHYHYGADFRAEEGTPVHAAHNGSVRRIMYQRYGIGYGLVLEHAKGWKTLYGHLLRLDSSILEHPALALYREAIRTRQEFAANFPKGLIRVQAGKRIAYSGASGIGPAHLHFALIREGEYLDPLRFGLHLRDDSPPDLVYLRLLPVDSGTRIEGKAKPLVLRPKMEAKLLTEGKTRIYHFARTPTVVGKIRLQLSAFDPSPVGRSRRGLASGRLLVNHKPRFAFSLHSLHRMPRYAHHAFYDPEFSRISYRTSYLHNFSEHTLQRLPFASSKNGGLVHFESSSQTTRLRLEWSDSSGNTSALVLQVQGRLAEAADSRTVSMPSRAQKLQSHDGRFRAHINEGSLLEETRLRLGRYKPSRRQLRGLRPLSLAYTLGPGRLFFLKPVQIRLAAARSPDAGVYRLGSRGAHPVSGARWKDGVWSFEARQSGSFVVLRDTRPPSLHPPRRRVFFRSPAGVRPFRLSFRAQDTGSGIDYESLEVFVDGRKALAEHDRDLRLVEIFSPDSIYRKGAHKVAVRVRDRVGHRSGWLHFRYRVR